MGKIANLFAEQHITLPLERKRQMLALDKEFDALQSKAERLEAENLKLRAEVNPLKKEIEELKQQSQRKPLNVQVGNLRANAPNVPVTNLRAVVCDHCGSDQLKRVGSRPDPIFAAVGIKQAVFQCLLCGKESAFTP